MGATIRGRADAKGMRVAVVTARFNETVTRALADGCCDELTSLGIGTDDVTTVEVPGARELPVACKAMADSGGYNAIVAIGCVIRGQTAHFDYVAGEASRGCAQVATDTGVPVIFGVLTTETMDQAVDRAGGKLGNKGREAAHAAVEMANLLEAIAKEGGRRS